MTVFFRRGAFYGDFATTDPKWHIAKDVPEDKYGVYTAHCGYARSNILGELKVSRAKKPKKVSETCSRCVAAMSGKPMPKKEKPKPVGYELNEAGEVVPIES